MWMRPEWTGRLAISLLIYSIIKWKCPTSFFFFGFDKLSSFLRCFIIKVRHFIFFVCALHWTRGQRARVTLVRVSAHIHDALSHKYAMRTAQRTAIDFLSDHFECRLSTFFVDSPTLLFCGCTNYERISDSITKRAHRAIEIWRRIVIKRYLQSSATDLSTHSVSIEVRRWSTFWCLNTIAS